MNCITDFICDYHSKYGLIENVNIISIDNDDCAINILSTKSLIRTSLINVKILNKSHEQLQSVDKIDTKQTLILSIDGYCCMVKAIKFHDDQTVEVMPTSDLLLNNEHTKRVSIDHLSICGNYENFDALKLLTMPMSVEYSRYFNNITIFSPLLTQTKNALLCWNVEQLQLNVYAFNEVSLKKVEFLMPVFISQLSLLLSGKLTKTIDMLSSYLVWEYQYENEEEANHAIGPKGSHILAVRNFRGIAGVVLTKSNRLRIIAENKFALKEARSLLEIKSESYMFDDSFIPILIGKNANHINELVTKAGLHCIHVPNSPWTGTLNDHVTVNDPSSHSKRELHLFGTRESINSAKLLLEMEESVKDLKKEFELRKNNKLRHSLSLKSSTSSISKESEKLLPNWDKNNQEEVFEDPVGNVDITGKLEQPPQPLSWADTLDDSGDESKPTEPLTNTNATGKEGGYTDFFSSQTTNARIRRQQQQQQQKKPPHNWNQNHHNSSPEPRSNNTTTTAAATSQNNQQKRINRKIPKQYSSLGSGGGTGGAGGTGGTGGGLLFTNSSLTSNEEKEEFYHHQQQQNQMKSTGNAPACQQQQQNRHRNSNNPQQNNNWNNNNNNNNNNFRLPKNNDRRSYQQHHDGYNSFSHHPHHQSTL
uniref:FMRR1 n=1 Tax=Dugesia japonica TaxID=6161 RepID=A0A2U8U4L9_DUGJA|nr:FMRR1 [Dugesia japonica]